MKKTRTIIAAVLMFLIVLLLIIIVVAVATRKPVASNSVSEGEESAQVSMDNREEQKPEKNDGEQSEEGNKQNDKKDESQEIKEDVSDENLPPVSNDDESATIQTIPENGKSEGEEVKTIEIDSKDEDLPKTGPESAIPLAILLGTATMFAASCVCVREKRVI